MHLLLGSCIFSPVVSLIAVIVVILLLSGFFSGSEAALVSVTHAEVEALKHKNRIGSATLGRVHKHLNRSVITIVVFNNAINIVGSIIVGQMVITMYGDAVLAVITTALTFGIIVFSEIIPKSFGIHHAIKTSLFCAPIILALTMILLPVIVSLERVTHMFRGGERKVGTEEQIRSLVTLGRRRGHIESDEGQLIHRAFILNDKTAEDIMTPLKDVIALNNDSTIADSWEKIGTTPHSRYPIYGASVHDVEGIAFKSDILEALYHGKGEDSVTTICRDSLVVISTMTSDELIGLFRDQNKHIAIVQSDGRTIGLVTLEDVLEELVGEIEDETDVGESS